MEEPRWLSRLLVDVIHSALLAEHGGRPGIRAGGDDLIESAVARPRHHYLHATDADLASLAAAYLVGLTMNHAYVDGNTRVGFACAATFLRLNGLRLTAPEVEAYETVIGLTEGRITEEQIATWIRHNTTRH
jgi:death-on-curing protein